MMISLLIKKKNQASDKKKLFLIKQNALIRKYNVD
jgi:hypothetical protein